MVEQGYDNAWCELVAASSSLLRSLGHAQKLSGPMWGSLLHRKRVMALILLHEMLVVMEGT